MFDLFIHNCMDVFAVTETWFDSSIDDHEIFPYHGGGVAFLLSSRAKFAVRPDLCECHMDRNFSEYKEVYVTILCLPPLIPIQLF